MVKLNKSTQYALYAIVELSSQPDAVLSVAHIAKKYSISDHHVAKVLQQLVRSGLIRSIRGTNGGFQIATDPKKVTMLDVVNIFEPQHSATDCPLVGAINSCDLQPECGIGVVLNEIQAQAIYTLKSVSIATLVSPKRIA